MHHPDPFDPQQCREDFDESAAQVGVAAAFLGPIGGRIGAVAAYALHEIGKEVCDQPSLAIETPSYIGGKIGYDIQHDAAPSSEPGDRAPHHELDFRAGAPDSQAGDEMIESAADDFDYDATQADEGPGFDFAAAAADYESGADSASDTVDAAGSDAG